MKNTGGSITFDLDYEEECGFFDNKKKKSLRNKSKRLKTKKRYYIKLI